MLGIKTFEERHQVNLAELAAEYAERGKHLVAVVAGSPAAVTARWAELAAQEVQG